MEWSIAASNSEEVVEQTNLLLHKFGLTNKYAINNVERIHPKMTDYKVTFTKQV